MAVPNPEVKHTCTRREDAACRACKHALELERDVYDQYNRRHLECVVACTCPEGPCDDTHDRHVAAEEVRP